MTPYLQRTSTVAEPSIRSSSESTRPVAIDAGEVSDSCFRAVANGTCDWESWHAPDGRLLWVNSAVEKITGYSPQECLQMNDYPLPMTAPPDRQRIVRVLEEARAGKSFSDLEFQSLHRDGGLNWMAVSWQPMYSDEGQHLGFRTSIRDVTQRRKLQDEIRRHAEHLEQLVQERTARVQHLERHRRQMEKAAALGQLAAGVAHEVNNPLAGIRNAFELIKSDLGPDHAHFELLELIDREIDRIASIVHQMYQLYRRDPQEATEFELDRTVAEVAWLLSGVTRKHQVDLQTTCTLQSKTVYLPEGEVKQILYNLIRNAIQASTRGATVWVQIDGGPNEVRVAVSDQGDGISEDALPRVFDPFFTTKSGEPGMGMGLGLSVSRSLVEAMGGSIDVHTADGEGSCFTATFPKNPVAQDGGSHE